MGGGVLVKGSEVCKEKWWFKKDQVNQFFNHYNLRSLVDKQCLKMRFENKSNEILYCICT